MLTRCLEEPTVANVDADPQPEILVATDRLYDGALYIIDGKTHLVERQYVAVAGPVYRIRWSDKQQIATSATNYSESTARRHRPSRCL